MKMSKKIKRLKKSLPTLGGNLTTLLIVALIVGGTAYVLSDMEIVQFNVYGDRDSNTTTTTTTPVTTPTTTPVTTPPALEEFTLVGSFEWDVMRSDFHVGIPEDILIGVYLNGFHIAIEYIYMTTEKVTYLADGPHVYTEGDNIVLKMEPDFGGQWEFFEWLPFINIVEPQFVVGTDGYTDFMEFNTQWNFAVMHVQWVPA